MENFAVYLLNTQNLLIMVSVWILLGLVPHLMPDISTSRIWARLLPLMPILGCSALVWLPGLVDGGPSEKALLGIVLGAFAGHAHKVLKQGIFGDDKRIKGNRPVY